MASFVLAARDLAYWDVAAQRWVTEDGPVTLEIGASSPRPSRAGMTVDLDTFTIHGQTHGLEQGKPT